jgi:hypothetical protein
MEKSGLQSLMDPDWTCAGRNCDHKCGMTDNGNSDPMALTAQIHPQLNFE